MLVPVYVLSTFCFLWSIFQLCSVFPTLMSTFCLRLVFAQSMFCLQFVLRSVYVQLILCCHLPSENTNHTPACSIWQGHFKERLSRGVYSRTALKIYLARPKICHVWHLAVSNTPITFFHGQFRIVEKVGRVFESFILEIHIFGISQKQCFCKY